MNKFSHTRFEPMGHTKNPDIRIAKSIVDYIFRWLGITFLPGYREAMVGHPAVDEGPAGRPTEEDAETETRLAATKAGEPSVAQGSATQATLQSTTPNGVKARAGQNGSSSKKSADSKATDNASLLERAGVMHIDLNGGTFSIGPNSSPASKPTPPVATTAAPSPSATAIAICATTAATAWVARKGLPGRRPASNPL